MALKKTPTPPEKPSSGIFHSLWSTFDNLESLLDDKTMEIVNFLHLEARAQLLLLFNAYRSEAQKNQPSEGFSDVDLLEYPPNFSDTATANSFRNRLLAVLINTEKLNTQHPHLRELITKLQTKTSELHKPETLTQFWSCLYLSDSSDSENRVFFELAALAPST